MIACHKRCISRRNKGRLHRFFVTRVHSRWSEQLIRLKERKNLSMTHCLFRNICKVHFASFWALTSRKKRWRQSLSSLSLEEVSELSSSHLFFSGKPWAIFRWRCSEPFHAVSTFFPHSSINTCCAWISIWLPIWKWPHACSLSLEVRVERVTTSDYIGSGASRGWLVEPLACSGPVSRPAHIHGVHTCTSRQLQIIPLTLLSESSHRVSEKCSHRLRSLARQLPWITHHEATLL